MAARRLGLRLSAWALSAALCGPVSVVLAASHVGDGAVRVLAASGRVRSAASSVPFPYGSAVPASAEAVPGAGSPPPGTPLTVVDEPMIALPPGQFVLDVIQAAISRTDDIKKIKAREKASFEAQKVRVNLFKLLFGSLFRAEVSMSDQPGEPVTATFEKIGQYLMRHDKGAEALIVRPD